MKTEKFDYFLPKEFIAQDPLVPRDGSKLMIYDSRTDRIEHKIFREVSNFLKKGDVIVVNTSKVIPARILFEDNGSKREIFLLRKNERGRYLALVKPGRAFKLGSVFKLGNLHAEVKEVEKDGTRSFEFEGENVGEALKKLGTTPLPPYITKSHSDPYQYQTVYAHEEGSVAAPTAGFHFTDSLMADLREKGVIFEEVVLHVGRGTFLPVTADKIEDHVMHSERFELNEETAERLNKAKVEGRRIIAIGTTSVRVLESCFKDGRFVPGVAETDIYIYPGYKWKAVDALITNFHLPKSTLLMLVSSFLENKMESRFQLDTSRNSPSLRYGVGVENSTKKLLELYEIAKSNNYRFYSFGDAMFII